MDWALAVERHRVEVMRIVVSLFALAGMMRGVAVGSVPRHVHLAVLDVLRAAEAAARRVIAVAAFGLVPGPVAARAAPTGQIPRGTGERVPSFPMFDRRRQVGVEKKTRGKPGVRDLAQPLPPCPPEPSPDDPVDGAALSRRMEALLAALEDVPKEARRMVRAMARRGLRPMRPGRPPGHRERWQHPVDTVLADCHQLALLAAHENDTS